MSGAAVPHRRPSSLAVAITLSLAVHALAAVVNFGPGISRERIVEPSRAIPMRLVAASKPAAMPESTPSAMPAELPRLNANARPEPRPSVNREAHAPKIHSHPHPHPHSHAAARRADPVPQRPASPTSTVVMAREAATTPAPHGDQPRVQSRPDTSNETEPVARVAAPAIPPPPEARDEPSAPTEVEPRAAPPVPVVTAAVATPARASGNDDRIEPPHYNVAYLNNPKPEYPAVARRMRLQGEVIVRAMVEPTGRAGDLKIQRSSGVELLDEAALRAVRDYRFVPAKRGSEAVTHWVDIPFAFRLTD